jgi:pimeloyl-ACP methyl ester carboxylesterase
MDIIPIQTTEEIKMRRSASVFLYVLAGVFILAAVVAGPAVAQDKFFNSNGVQIRYIEEGTGEPIVLVHGYTGNLDLSWMDTGVFQNLAKDHHVIALDNRGHGKSGKPHDPKAYGTEMSEDIVRLMDHLNIRRAHIIGYSLGGRIVSKLVTMHPDRFLTAILGGNGLNTAADEPDAEAVKVEAAETARGDFHSLIVRTAATDQPPPSDEAIRAMSRQTVERGNDPLALAAFVRTRRSLTVTKEQMAAVRVPVLAVVGSLDPNLAKVNRLKIALPSLKVVVIQGAVHSSAKPPLGAARRPEFVNAVREFIAAHKETGSP